MLGEKELLKEKIVNEVLARICRYSEAAHQLGVTRRTIQNYVRRFLIGGPEGLKDHRRGNHRKLSGSEEQAILTLKRERPERSVRQIRDRLGLKVSEEAVRLVLVKHDLARRVLKPSNGTSRVLAEAVSLD